MKKNNLLPTAVALLISSPFVAQADSQYPATDFEPKVIYQDASVKSAPAATAAPVAANTPAPATVVDADDAKYPATNFQPKVLFKDDNYKPPKATPVAEYKSSAAEVVKNDPVLNAEIKDDNSSNLLVLGLLAAGIGFALSKKCPKFAKSVDETPAAPRETGVTRYLNARIPKVSGVAKYLERTGKPTNVARYIAKQNIAQKAAQNDTDRG